MNYKILVLIVLTLAKRNSKIVWTRPEFKEVAKFFSFFPIAGGFVIKIISDVDRRPETWFLFFMDSRRMKCKVNFSRILNQNGKDHN